MVPLCDWHGTLGLQSLTGRQSDTDEIASLRSPEFTLGVRRMGCLEERSSEELTEPRQFMIAWLIRDSLAGSYVSTGQISAMSRGCFAPYRVVWDPSDFTTYELVRESFTWRDLADVVSGHMGECTTWQQSRSGHTLQAGLIQSLPILGQGWGSNGGDCITDSLRVQSILIDQTAEFTHFPVISWEYGGHG
jgi:hypothetical protein